MRDMVEIGMGRTARRTYELDDINIVPSRRTRSSQDVSTAWQLDAYRFEVPVVAHPTDSLVSVEFAIEMGRLGGLGVLNGEGLIGRHADVEDKIAQVLDVVAVRAVGVVGKSGREQRARELFGFGHPYRPAVQKRAAAARGREHLVPRRVVDRAKHELFFVAAPY